LADGKKNKFGGNLIWRMTKKEILTGT